MYTHAEGGLAGHLKDPDGHLFKVDYETAWAFDTQHHLRVDESNIV